MVYKNAKHLGKEKESFTRSIAILSLTNLFLARGLIVCPATCTGTYCPFFAQDLEHI
jgi:hypothetical protein